MVNIPCVNCGAMRAEHHPDGWCFWISDKEHLPLAYSTEERTILQLVDENGQPLQFPAPEDEDEQA